jgi:hypothetical protein
MSSLQQNWRKGQNRFCLEVRGAGGRNEPNNVCTYKYMNKGKKEKNYKAHDGTLIVNCYPYSTSKACFQVMTR